MERVRGKLGGIVKGAAAAVALSAVTLFAAVPAFAATADTGIPDGYEPETYNAIPAQQFKNVFETATIEVSGIKVNFDHMVSWTDTVKIRVFNSTTQETEFLGETINEDSQNYVPPLELKLHHNYIIFVEDEKYQLGTKKYFQVLDGSEPAATDGPGAYDYKTENLKYDRLTSFTVYKRDSACGNPYDDNRYNTDSKLPVYVRYKGLAVPGVKFHLVSELETLDATSASDGKLKANLIEDVTYMVYVDSDRYVIEPFPIVAKDKSEYKEGRYCYNHSTCNRVQEITLYDPGETTFDGYERVLSVESLKGRVTVEGMNFRHLLILDRILDTKVAALEGTSYDVVDITAVNPHRWEISKLAGTDFTIRRKAPAGKVVSHVYALENGTPRELAFMQEKDGTVRFASDSLSLHPFAIQYFEAGAANIADATFDAIAEVTYTGSALKPKVTARYGGLVLKEGADYALEYANNVNVGTAKVTVRGMGTFSGSKQLSFKVVPKKVTPKLTLAKTEYVYSDKAVKPGVTVKNGSEKLVSSAFSISYASGRKAVGTYRVTVTMKDPFAGTASVTFKINPKGTALKKLAAGKKQVSVTWKKQATQTTGYQLMYSTSKSFKSAKKTALIKGAKKTKSVIKKLKSGKTYYVKVRTYKKVAGKTYYSAWSKPKSVKVK